MTNEYDAFEVKPIGAVRRDGDKVTIHLDSAYSAGLHGLDTFSHVIIYWWAHRFDAPAYRETLVVPLPYAENHDAGVFACRSPLRPNLIMSTVCEIITVDVDTGKLQIRDIDAFDTTPVLDLKAYFPVTDRVKDAHTSDYLVGWPEWMPETGIGLMEGEA